ncbi:MAG: TrpR-like protein [Oscillospiraceae bacterium]|nr:TrpR-like protein [Oscillospiraceae bacterium]
MNKHIRKPRNEKLYEAILKLETMDECMRFFDDLCTVSELMAMEQRYQVASCLNDGMIYNDILAQTGASSATISRVNRSLQYGKGGYAVVFDRLREKDS